MSTTRSTRTTLPDAPEPQLSPVRVLLAARPRRARRRARSSRSATWRRRGPRRRTPPRATPRGSRRTSTRPSRRRSPSRTARPTRRATSCSASSSPADGRRDVHARPGAPTRRSTAPPRRMDLDRRVAQVRGQGGDAIISFGGQANTRAGGRLRRRGRARVGVPRGHRPLRGRHDRLRHRGRRARRHGGERPPREGGQGAPGRGPRRRRPLAVWLTLPVTPEGLNADALAVVRTMLAAKVDLAGVNVMAMDFGVPSAAQDMRGAVTSSLTATHAPARRALRARRSAPRELWGKLGVTVMIGQNDVDGERLSVADARAIAALRRLARHRPRLDVVAEPRHAVRRDLPGHRDALQPLQRRRPEAAGVHEDVRPAARHRPREVRRRRRPPTGCPRRRPARRTTRRGAPTRSGSPSRPYREGYKVVWHQAVYVAKWYSQGQTPDAENVAPGDAPWRLVGPVLSTDRAPEIPKLPAGTHPKWTRARSSGRRPRALPGPALPGELVHAGRPARRDRPERHAVAVEAALPDPRRADRRLTRVSGCG